jgi:hypothetical protein
MHETDGQNTPAAAHVFRFARSPRYLGLWREQLSALDSHGASCRGGSGQDALATGADAAEAALGGVAACPQVDAAAHDAPTQAVANAVAAFPGDLRARLSGTALAGTAQGDLPAREACALALALMTATGALDSAAVLATRAISVAFAAVHGSPCGSSHGSE